MARTKAQQAERREAIERLREWIKPGDTIYTSLKHVSASGMSRTIQVVQIVDNEPRWIGWNVAKAIDEPYDDRREGVKIGGAGMDMGFAIVYSLSHTLFPDGFGCVGERCPSSDHSNGDRDYTPHVQMLPNPHHDNKLTPTVVGVGHWHTDGGYALRHRWL